jgi:hypothetical protein
VITPDDGHRRRPKHAEIRDEINFGYLMHLVGYFIQRLLNIKTIKQGVVQFVSTAGFNGRFWDNKISLSTNPTDRWKGNSVTYD